MRIVNQLPPREMFDPRMFLRHFQPLVERSAVVFTVSGLYRQRLARGDADGGRVLRAPQRGIPRRVLPRRQAPLLRSRSATTTCS